MQSFDIPILIIWSNRIHSWKYQRSTSLVSKDLQIRKVEFVTKTQLLRANYTSLKHFIWLKYYILSSTKIHCRSLSLNSNCFVYSIVSKSNNEENIVEYLILLSFISCLFIICGANPQITF